MCIFKNFVCTAQLYKKKSKINFIFFNYYKYQEATKTSYNFIKLLKKPTSFVNVRKDFTGSHSRNNRLTCLGSFTLKTHDGERTHINMN